MHFIVIDHQRLYSPLCPADVAIPLYLETGDVIKVRGDNDEVWIAHILSVNVSTQSLSSKFLCRKWKYLQKGVQQVREHTLEYSIRFSEFKWFLDHSFTILE